MKNKVYSLLKSRGITIRYFSVRRKYPFDPDHAKEMPIFQYVEKAHTRNRVYVWGNAITGALGLPRLKRKENLELVNNIKSPKRMHFAEKHDVITMCAGFGFTAFGIRTLEGDKIYATGLNSDSQIGYHEVRANHPLGVIFYPQPVFLPFRNPDKTKIMKLAAGRAHMCVLTDEGLYLLGNNSYGQCGRRIIQNENYTGSKFINYIETVNGHRISDVICGQDHTMIITDDGMMHSCGWGADGQTGLGHFNSCDQFSQLSGDVKGEFIIKVAATSDFVLCLNDKGDCFGWGNTEYGQLLQPGDAQQVAVPTYIEKLKNIGPIKDIASGGSFALILNCAGEIYVWGYGLLGVGPNVQQALVPELIPRQLFGYNDFNPDSRVISIACGLGHMVALTNKGDLYSWGRNRAGCLGLGHEKDQFFPLKVSLGASVHSVFCGLDHTIALCTSYITDNRDIL